MDTPTYRVLVGDQSFDLSFEGEHVIIDGETRDYSFEVLREGYASLIVDGVSLPVFVDSLGDGQMRVTIAGQRREVQVKDERDLLVDAFGLAPDEGSGGDVRAPMPGLVLEVLVEEGDVVEAEQGLLVLEAMKMENELSSPAAGIVTAVHVESGAAVDKDELLIEIGAAD